MHLQPYPQYFLKDGERRAANYTVEARELLEAGWVAEKNALIEALSSAPTTEPAPEPEPAEPAEPAEQVDADVVEDEDAEPAPIDERIEDADVVDFAAMTRLQLLAYAEKRGVDLRNNLSKAELIEACQAL